MECDRDRIRRLHARGRSLGEISKLLRISKTTVHRIVKAWIAVYGYGCIVRIGTDTQIADLLVEKGAHPLETCAPYHFCDPWPKLLKDQHEWGTILSLTLAHYRAFGPLPGPNHESFGPRSKVRFAVTSVNGTATMPPSISGISASPSGSANQKGCPTCQNVTAISQGSEESASRKSSAGNATANCGKRSGW